MNPTQDALNARLNPQATTVQSPTQGLFRAVGDFGSAIFGTDQASGKLISYNLIGDNSGLFKDSTERASFGNAGGQASEALRRLKDQYGIDYNSLSQVNMGDYIQQLARKGIAKSINADGQLGDYSINGDFNSLKSPQQTATLNNEVINNTPNQISPLAQQPVNNPTPQPLAVGGSTPLANTTNNYTGNSIVDYLNTGGKASDFNSRAQLAESMGINGYTGTAEQNTQLLSALRTQSQNSNSQATGSPIPNGSTPFGTVSQNTPISLGTNTNGVFSSDVLGSNLTTQDVLNKTQSYNDVINGYLKQQADAQAALNNTRVSELQGKANIYYGNNGAGGADMNVQGAQLDQLNRDMAFKTLPAEVNLSNAQTGLALFKQSPEYLAQQQSLSTAQNLIQQFPDLGVNYNPNITPEQNLQVIQSAVSKSPRFQAMNSVLGVNPITGQPMIINKLGSSVQGTTLGGTTGGSPGQPTAGSQTSYVPGSAITTLPPGVRSTGSAVLDQTAMAVFNGTQAPSEVKGRGIQSDAILNQANAISQSLTGKPFDVAAAQSAYDFRQTPKYQGYMSSAPTAIRNIQAMRDDAEKLKLGGITGINWTKINLMAQGLWFSSAQDKATAADLVSKYNQSKDDIGLLLGTGQGSDAKIALGGLIFTPAGAPYTTNQLAQNVSDTILSKMGDYYKQAGVKDPTPYLSKDTAQIWQNFQSSNSNTGSSSVGLNQTSQSILQKYGIK